MRRKVIAAIAAAGIALALPTSAYAQGWKTAEVSWYGGADEPWETTTAIGTAITDSSMGIAVPMQQVVTYKTWKKHKSLKYRKTHFYYGERIKLRHKVRTRSGKSTYYFVTAKVVDCGGFLRYGRYSKSGKWIPRQFDLQPAVKRALRCGDLSVVSWKWVR